MTSSVNFIMPVFIQIWFNNVRNCFKNMKHSIHLLEDLLRMQLPIDMSVHACNILRSWFVFSCFLFDCVLLLETVLKWVLHWEPCCFLYFSRWMPRLEQNVSAMTATVVLMTRPALICHGSRPESTPHSGCTTEPMDTKEKLSSRTQLTWLVLTV